jgi:hypothetical protein
MSFWGFMGFVSGLAAGIAAVAIRTTIVLRRGGSVETDEMTRAVYQKASVFTLSVTGLLVFGGWIADNVLRYSRGEPVKILSPWGIVAFTIIYAMFLSSLVLYWRHTGTFLNFDCPRHRQLGMAGGMLGISAVFFGRMLTTMRELALPLVPVMAFCLFIGGRLLVTGMRSKQ